MRRRDIKWLLSRLPPEIRALTVHQPFAWAIVAGHKSIENRKQPPPQEFIGEIVAIHAGKAPVGEADVRFISERVRGNLPRHYETGAVIGFARIVGSVRRAADLSEKQHLWFKGKYGWLIEDVVLLPTPVKCSGQQNLWRLPPRIMNRVRAQLDKTSSISGPTAFSWGYKGWGNAIPKLIEMFDAVERQRGFEPALFVDVRARRAGRAEGFIGKRNKFECELGEDRYRWMKELGNNAVKTGRGPNRLVNERAVYELLGLIFRAEQEDRRVVFFCSCASPCKSASCHRRIVSKSLIRAAKHLKLRLQVEEWPGGEPSLGTVPTFQVTEDELASVIDGSNTIDMGRRCPTAEFLGLPVGGIVRLKNKSRGILVSAMGATVRAGRWRLAIFPRLSQTGHTKAAMLAEAKRCRKNINLVLPLSSVTRV